VRIDTRLRTATATATHIRVHTTRYVPEESETWGYASADTRWVGSGPLDRIREGLIWRSERTSVRESTTGWQRDARATAVGRNPRGEFLGGFLAHVVQRESDGYRGGHLASPLTSAITTLTTGVPAAAPTLTRTRLESRYGAATWTTCPRPQKGDRCRDVVVSYDSLGPVTGEPDTFAFVGVYDYVVAEVTDDWVDVRTIVSVETYAPATSLRSPADLAGATLRVTDAEASLCDSDFNCTSTTLSVTADWTGTGTPRRFASHAVLWGDWGREWARTAGHTRPATATATLSGLPESLHMNGPVGGRLMSASISASRERHSAVER
jgi:hypothetical protein